MTRQPFGCSGRAMSGGALVIALLAGGALEACKGDSSVGNAGGGGAGGAVAGAGGSGRGGAAGGGGTGAPGGTGGTGGSAGGGGAGGAAGRGGNAGGSGGGAGGAAGGQAGRGGSAGGAAGAGGGQAGNGGGAGSARDAGADHVTGGGEGDPCWTSADCIPRSLGIPSTCVAPDGMLCGAYMSSNCDADSHAPAGRWRHMRSGMEFHPCLLQYLHHHLQWRKQGQQERFELYCAILEPGPGSDDCRPRRSCRLRRSVVYGRCLYHRRADAYSNSHSYTQSHADANSATAGQRDLRCV